MIFISHNHQDKAVVEQIAIRLKDIFGIANVFYDSWSMQPGEGIIDKMNEGLTNCKLFLFFVSKNSLQSKMVALEWQNALLKATKGQTKLIPIKLDDCMMPPILAQTLYIDLFSNGIEITLKQVVDIISGKNTFRPGPQEFSNLRSYMYSQGKDIIIEIQAIHYLEPNSKFMLLSKQTIDEISVKFLENGMFTGGYDEGVTSPHGERFNGFIVGKEKSTIPGFPIKIIAKGVREDIIVKILGVLHESAQNKWRIIPTVLGKPI
jgi:hypothetical protein